MSESDLVTLVPVGSPDKKTYFMTNHTADDTPNGMSLAFNSTDKKLWQFAVAAVEKSAYKPAVTSAGKSLHPNCEFAEKTKHKLVEIDWEKTQTLVIIQKEIGPKQDGRVRLFGRSPAKVDILDTTHRYATLKDEGDIEDAGSGNPQPCQLKSAVAGEFAIAWMPSDSESGDPLDGEQWCEVDIIGLGEEDFYATGSTDIPAGDYGRTVSTDYETGIMTVDIPDENDQPNIVVLMNDLTAGGRAIASRRNDVLINYDGEDEPQPGTTIGAQAGSSKPKPGNDGMTVLTAGPEAGRVRAGFFRPRNTWPVAKYLSLVAYYKNFDAETTVQPNTPSIDIVNADTYTHTQEAILYNPVIPKGDYIFHLCPILRVHGEWYNYGYSTLRVINYAYADSSSFGLKNPYYQITSTTEFLYDAGDGVEEKIADDIEYSYSSSSSAGFHFPTFNKDYNAFSYTRQSSGGTGLAGIKPEVYYERKQFARAITKTMKGTGRMIARTTFSGSHSLTIWATYSNNQYASRIVVLGGNILGAGKVGVGLDCVMTGDLNAG